MTFMISMIGYALEGLASGRILKKTGPGPVLLAAAVLFPGELRILALLLPAVLLPGAVILSLLLSFAIRRPGEGKES